MDKLNSFLHKTRYLSGFLAVFAVGLAVAVFYHKNYALEILSAHHSLSKVLSAVVFLCAVLALASYVFIIRLKVNSLKSYVCFAFIAACLMSMIFPPNTVPDEWTHFKNAYYYSNILMGRSELNAESTISIRSCDGLDNDSQVSPQKYIAVFDGITVFNHGDRDRYTAFEKKLVSSSPFYVYLPQIIAITLSRILNLSGVFCYYLARSFNLILYFVLLVLAIKRMPFAKNALAIIGTLPVTLQQSMSVSSDSFITGTALLLFATAMDFLHGNKPIKVRDVVFITVLSMLLAPCKLIYFATGLIAVLTPADRFSDVKARRLTRIMLPLLTVVSLLSLQFANIFTHIDTVSVAPPYADAPSYTIDIVFNDTGKFIHILANSIIGNASYYYSSMICSSFGTMQFGVSGLITVLFSIVLFTSFVTDRDKTAQARSIKPVEKLFSGVVFVGTVLLVFLSMMTSWTPNNYDYISGVQGRYFLPVLPLLIPIMMTDRITASKRFNDMTLFFANALTFYIVVYLFGKGCLAGV